MEHYFGNKQYFKCGPTSAVFVGLDELEPLEDEGLVIIYLEGGVGEK